MRKFLYNTFLYLLPIFLLILFIEMEYRSIPNDWSYKSQSIENMKEKIEILAIGSSLIYGGVNPKYFNQKCYNFGMNDQSINYNYFILKKYIDELPNLQYVIMSLSYPALAYRLEEGKAAFKKYYYIHYMNYNKLTLKDITSPEYYLTISNQSGTTVLKRLFQYWFYNKNNTTCDSNGWFNNWPEVLPTDSLKRTLAINEAKHHENYSFDPQNMEYLNKIIQLCAEQNVKLLLFTPPSTSYYINHFDPKKKEMLQRKGDSIASQYSFVRYINLLNNTTFTDSLFMDGTHLNTTGSKILSKKLNTMIKTPE